MGKHVITPVKHYRYIMKTKLKNTIKYLLDNGVLKEDIFSDPINLIMESELSLTDNEYNKAINYIKDIEDEY